MQRWLAARSSAQQALTHLHDNPINNVVADSSCCSGGGYKYVVCLQETQTTGKEHLTSNIVAGDVSAAAALLCIAAACMQEVPASSSAVAEAACSACGCLQQLYSAYPHALIASRAAAFLLTQILWPAVPLQAAVHSVLLAELLCCAAAPALVQLLHIAASSVLCLLMTVPS